MPPGRGAHAAGPDLRARRGRRSSRPVKMMSRKTVPCRKTSNSGSRAGCCAASRVSSTIRLRSRCSTGRHASVLPADWSTRGGGAHEADDPRRRRVPRAARVRRAAARHRRAAGSTRSSLHDSTPAGSTAVAHVLPRSWPAACPTPPTVSATTDLDTALAGADFVFSAIRVGGLEGRSRRRAGGARPRACSARRRPAPAASPTACAPSRSRSTSPDACAGWPRRLGHQLHQPGRPGHRGDAVRCSATGSSASATRRSGLAGAPPARSGSTSTSVAIDYVGLNHLGWLRGAACTTATTCCPAAGRRRRAGAFEEGRLFGAGWLRRSGALPNEYLYYYYFTRDAVAPIRAAAQTRGEFLLDQQAELLRGRRRRPAHGASAQWDAVRREREATYMAETREADGERATSGRRRRRRLRGGRARPDARRSPATSRPR